MDGVTGLPELLPALWWLIRPSTLVMVSTALGLWLLCRRVFGPGLLLVSLALLVLSATLLPVAEWLTGPLESRHPRPTTLPDQVDGIIVLGGRGSPRLQPFAELALRYPNATLVFSGGGGEAESAWRFLTAFNLTSRLVLEERSRDTYENARYSRAMVQPEPGEVWLLVTSAMHMPRAVGVFLRLGWPVIPYPVDYLRLAPVTQLPARFRQLDEATREWLATAHFNLMGYTQRPHYPTSQTPMTPNPQP